MDITYSWDERNNPKEPYVEHTLTVKVGGDKFSLHRRVNRMELECAIAPARLTAWVKQDMLRHVGYSISEHIMDMVRA